MRIIERYKITKRAVILGVPGLMIGLAACRDPVAPRAAPCTQPADFTWRPVVDSTVSPPDTLAWIGYCYTGGTIHPVP